MLTTLATLLHAAFFADGKEWKKARDEAMATFAHGGWKEQLTTLDRIRAAKSGLLNRDPSTSWPRWRTKVFNRESDPPPVIGK